jgi:protoporphyrinogen oxidase
MVYWSKKWGYDLKNLSLAALIKLLMQLKEKFGTAKEKKDIKGLSSTDRLLNSGT